MLFQNQFKLKSFSWEKGSKIVPNKRTWFYVSLKVLQLVHFKISISDAWYESVYFWHKWYLNIICWRVKLHIVRTFFLKLLRFCCVVCLKNSTLKEKYKLQSTNMKLKHVRLSKVKSVICLLRTKLPMISY